MHQISDAWPDWNNYYGTVAPALWCAQARILWRYQIEPWTKAVCAHWQYLMHHCRWKECPPHSNIRIGYCSLTHFEPDASDSLLKVAVICFHSELLVNPVLQEAGGINDWFPLHSKWLVRVSDALPIFLTLVMHHHYHSPLAGDAQPYMSKSVMHHWHSPISHDAQPYMFKSVMHDSESHFPMFVMHHWYYHSPVMHHWV